MSKLVLTPNEFRILEGPRHLWECAGTTALFHRKSKTSACACSIWPVAPILMGLAIALSCTANSVVQDKNVLLVSLGDIPQESVEIAAQALSEKYNVVLSFEKAELPDSAFYEPRSRHRAERLLEFLEESYPGYDRVMGLTSQDISTTMGGKEDWGIFGLARVGGKSAVVSTFRLNRNGVATDKFENRLYKVIVHEYGHTVGLLHCEASDVCPMQHANGKVNTVDDSIDALCEDCADQVSGDVRGEEDA